MPNGRLLSGSFDTTWAVWDTKIGFAAERFRTDLGNETVVRAVAVSPGPPSMPGTALISNERHIIHFDLSSRKTLHGLDHTGAVRCIAMSADCRRAISGGQDSKARYWDLDTGQQIWERELPGWVYSAAISPDGSRIFAAISPISPDGSRINPIRVFDAAGNQVKSVGDAGVIGLSLSPDGKRCLAHHAGVKLWDLESGAELAQFESARGGGSRPVFSPDGRYAAWGGDEEFVSLWDIDNHTMVAEFEHAPLGSSKHRRHPHDWMPVAFSPDGKLLASGADDGTIYLWNVPEMDGSGQTDSEPPNREPTQRGEFTPLDLSGAATVVSTLGMFHGKDDTAERIVFDDWSPKTFEGVPFELVDPRGDRVPNAVLLYGPNGDVAPRMPTSVRVDCNKPAGAIHFLSGVSGFAARGEIKGGSVSMIARLCYADGQTEDHPLRNGEYFADYIGEFDVPKSKLAFVLRGRQLRYFALYPKRREPIERIELLKGPDPTAPIVMAITIEGP